MKTSGHHTPLRYPGGKGKLAKYIKAVIDQNQLRDGIYVEPYTGGGAVAIELLLEEYVTRVHINDLDYPIYAFWKSVLEDTEELIRLIYNTPISVETWDQQKAAMSDSKNVSGTEVGFAMFYLNRTNRSGILNAGIIGGRAQTGRWKMDARFNKPELVARIEAIARRSRRISLTNLDAMELMASLSSYQGANNLVYLDPPYYAKGKDLYLHSYGHDDHVKVASVVRSLGPEVHWVVSYDNVEPIRQMYQGVRSIEYSISYSARTVQRGAETMFFSNNLRIPQLVGDMERC